MTVSIRDSTGISEAREFYAINLITRQEATDSRPMKSSAPEKRPIDLIRESAGSMDVGLPDEGKVSGFYKIGDERLLIIKQRAVYEITFADKIDPKRKNARIPNVQQRLLSAGSDDELVQRILLTADQLFDPTYLAKFDCAKLREHALSALRELLAMARIRDRVTEEQSRLLERVDTQKLAHGFIVPSLPDAEQDIKNYFLRADHFRRELMRIARVFDGRFENIDKLLRKEKSTISPDEQFIEFLERAVPFIHFIRESRNAIEHPHRTKNVVVRDFSLNEDANLVAPTIEVTLPRAHQPPADLTHFVSDVIVSLANLFCDLIAIMSERNAALAGFEVTVAKLPPQGRRYEHVEFTYAVSLNGEFLPIG